MAIIRTIQDLENEIARLNELKDVQGAALAKRFNSPSAIMATAMSVFPKAATDGLKGTGFFNQDFLGLLSRLLLPLTLNKTLFRNSNFIVKALVGLISQKASHYISEDSVTSVWDRGKISVYQKNESPNCSGKAGCCRNSGGYAYASLKIKRC